MKLLILNLILMASAGAQTEVTVLVSPDATGIERLAASELADHLRLLYPSSRFAVGERAAAGASVLIGTPATLPELAAQVNREKLKAPESFVVTTARTKNAPLAIIAGAEPRGTLFAVYALLEKLGFGFYLSYNTHPPARRGPFTFEGWELADRPLAPNRLVFNWHNFLSGCSTWDLPDWESWVTQAARMRFNGIMVHAYGNNPMFSFTHNGLTKPTGYLSTTARGRDWGTEHVLDVRTIIGGSSVFDKAVFGSSAGLVPENETVHVATALMQKVFQFAAARGLGVTVALDVDTETANPQNIIGTLPASARFTVNGVELVNPETAEGHAYYRSQIRQLLETYPEITQIAIWFRGGRNSPWREVKRDDFPQSWRTQYDQALAANPSLRDDPEAPSMFAIGKIATVFRAILDETGHRTTALAAGSWRFEFVRAADAFLPEGVVLLPLDYDYAFPADSVREAILAASSHRPVIPIVWAQHDDRGFSGRPYLPFTGFASMLRRTGGAGFGIIHWTTRPLDLYFKSLADQVWSSSENEQIETTSEHMAERTFGQAASGPGGRYLLSWIQDAPMFGRETSDRFLDQAIDETPVLEGCRRRLQLLERAGTLTKSPQALAWVNYFRDWEHFVMEFHRAQAAWQRSVAALKRGDNDLARLELANASPESVIEQYARAIVRGGTTRGEQGILISLNLRWLPYFISQRQALGMEPFRIRFAPTAPDPLAQSPGTRTFAFDTGHHLWLVLGEAEVQAEVLPRGNGDNCSGGLKVDRAVSLPVKLIGGERLPPGKSELDVELNAGGAMEIVDGGTERVNSTHKSIAVAAQGGTLDLILRPIGVATSVCSLVLRPIGMTSQQNAPVNQ